MLTAMNPTMTRRLSLAAVAAAALGGMAMSSPAASARPHLVCTITPGHTITRTIGFFYPPRTITITLPSHRVCHITF